LRKIENGKTDCAQFGEFLKQLIEYGPDELAALFALMFEFAMQAEREC